MTMEEKRNFSAWCRSHGSPSLTTCCRGNRLGNCCNCNLIPPFSPKCSKCTFPVLIRERENPDEDHFSSTFSHPFPLLFLYLSEPWCCILSSSSSSFPFSLNTRYHFSLTLTVCLRVWSHPFACSEKEQSAEDVSFRLDRTDDVRERGRERGERRDRQKDRDCTDGSFHIIISAAKRTLSLRFSFSQHPNKLSSFYFNCLFDIVIVLSKMYNTGNHQCIQKRGFLQRARLVKTLRMLYEYVNLWGNKEFLLF